jgi:hypothetical protein
MKKIAKKKRNHKVRMSRKQRSQRRRRKAKRTRKNPNLTEMEISNETSMRVFDSCTKIFMRINFTINSKNHK